MAAARKIMPWGYLTQVAPGPVFIGVEKPMKVYSFDNVLLTSAKVSDDIVYKFLDTLEKNKDELVAVQPVLREFSAEGRLQAVRRALSSGRLEIFQGAQSRRPKRWNSGTESAACGAVCRGRGPVMNAVFSKSIGSAHRVALVGFRRQRVGADLRVRDDAARHASTTRPVPPSPRC